MLVALQNLQRNDSNPCGGDWFMKKMQILVVAWIMLGLSVAVAEALPQYQVLNYPGRTGGGGPFLINPLSGDPDFVTFCLETTEYVSLNGTYYGSIEPFAVYGGVSGTSNTVDPLSDNTKKLYDYVLDNIKTLTSTQLTAIQYAIWAYEGEISYSTINSMAQGFYNSAPSYLLDRNIQVLNLWTSNVSAPYGDDWSSRAQSMLIGSPAPVPEPSTLLLLGSGLSGLGVWQLYRRKPRRKV
jgi:hypothetical protein